VWRASLTRPSLGVICKGITGPFLLASGQYLTTADRDLPV
jgi:hypothetical protein